MIGNDLKPAAISVATSSASTDSNPSYQGTSFEGDLVNVYRELLEDEEDVSTYIDPETGECITSQQFWERLQYRSQPGYVVGKYLRESVSGVWDSVASLYQFASRTIYSFSRPFWYIQDEKHLFKDLEEDIIEQHDDITLRIRQAKDQANEEKKPLLILLGENHLSRSSAVLESLILKIASNDLSIDTLFSETFFYSLYERHFMSSFPVYMAERSAKDLNMLKIPMDLAVCEMFAVPDHEGCAKKAQYPQVELKDASHEKGMKTRNQVMAAVIIKSTPRKDVLAIVGAEHLYGLLEQTNLKAHFHILPVNVVPHARIACFFTGFIIERYKRTTQDYLCKGKTYTPMIKTLETPFSDRVMDSSEDPSPNGLYNMVSKVVDQIEKTKKASLSH